MFSSSCTRWLTEKETAQLTGISVSSLQKQRFCRKGIPYAKVGRSVRYAVRDVQDYMQAHTIDFKTPEA